MRSAILSFGFVLLATTGTDANVSEATSVVTKFYSWYLAQHGDVDWYAPQHGQINWNLAFRHHAAKYFQARTFFHSALFEGLDQTYLKSIGDATPPFYVSTTSHEDAAAKMSSFDPYVGASLPATSFHVGSARIGTTTSVPVTFTFSNKPSRTQVTLIVRENGSSYQIYDIHYGSIPFYYAGPITDLLQFLSKYNC